jgi:hypothetical protein
MFIKEPNSGHYMTWLACMTGTYGFSYDKKLRTDTKII